MWGYELTLSSDNPNIADKASRCIRSLRVALSSDIWIIRTLRRCPTLRLLILPSVSPFPPTIRRTASISVLPIEPNLAERARISAINLDDYQLDPVTPPPLPSSPFSKAGYQRMIAETDPHPERRSSNCLRDRNWLGFGDCS
ncbi:hypothetical protein Tco_1213685 [Tanacetum coccineum]